MSQQINLAVERTVRRRGLLTSKRASLLLGIVLALNLANAGQDFYQVFRLQQQVDAGARTLETARGTLETASRNLAARESPETLRAQIAALRAQASGAVDLLGRLERGELGRTRGYTDYLSAIGRTTEDGVWVTEIQIRTGGRSVMIEGKSLRADAVPAFAAKASSAFDGSDTQFRSLDVTAESDASGLPGLVKFRLQ